MTFLFLLASTEIRTIGEKCSRELREQSESSLPGLQEQLDIIKRITPEDYDTALRSFVTTERYQVVLQNIKSTLSNGHAITPADQLFLQLGKYNIAMHGGKKW